MVEADGSDAAEVGRVRHLVGELLHAHREQDRRLLAVVRDQVVLLESRIYADKSLLSTVGRDIPKG